MFRLCAATVLAILLVSFVEDSTAAVRRVCYHTNWSQYRNGAGKFKPESIDPNICTHINYAFATLNGNRLKAFEWNDESTPWMKGMFERFQTLKQQNPSLKTLLAVGGWNLASAPFHRMVATDSSRREFATTTVAYLRKHGFDGLDLDWEYPALRTGSGPDDKHKFTLLCKVLREEFEKEAQSSGKPRLLLSAAVGAGKEKIDTSYEIPEIQKYLDYINLMTYDLHGAWEDHTGENSPLHAMASETGNDTTLNVEWAANEWAKRGMPKDKINVGMALYGHSFTLKDKNQHDVYDPMRSAGRAGHYTSQAGILAYYEICEMIKNGATKYYQKEAEVPYIVQGDQWVGYDDPDSLRKKVQFVKSGGFGGIMVWALPLDDFSGSCGNGKYPLMHAIMDEINNNSPIPAQTNPPQTAQPTTAPRTNPPVTNSPTTNQPRTNPPQTIAPQTNAPFTNSPVTNAPHTNPAATSALPQQHTLGLTSQYSCKNKASGFYANPTDRTKYYICAGGMAFEDNCAKGLEFNMQTKYCDSVASASTKATPIQTTIKATTNAPTAMTQKSTQNSSPTSVVNTKAAMTTAKTSMAQVTTMQTPMVQMSTEQTTMAQLNTKQTTMAQMKTKQTTMAQMKTKQTTMAQMNTKETTSNSGNGNTNHKFCDNKSDGIHADPADCSYFYECAVGLTFHVSCSGGTVFNGKFGTCDYPWHVPHCQNQG